MSYRLKRQEASPSVFNPQYGSNCISDQFNFKNYGTDKHVQSQSTKI